MAKPSKIRRYGIYLANLEPAMGSELRKMRPVVVVSDDLMNRYLETVVACPLTTTLHLTWRSRLPVQCDGRPAEVAVDQIRVLAKARLVRHIDQLSPEDALKLRLLITQMYGQSA